MKTITLICLFLVNTALAFCQIQQTTLNGEFSHLKDGDTVKLLIYKYGEYPYNAKEVRESVSAPILNHRFTVNLSFQDNRPYECRLIIPRMRITPNLFIIENGDLLHVSGTDVSINDLTGKGAEKTNILRHLDVIWNDLAQKATISSRKLSLSNGLLLSLDNSKKAVKLCRSYVNMHRKRLNLMDLDLLIAYAQNPIWDIYNTLYYSDFNAEQKDTVQAQLKKVWLSLRKSEFIPLDPSSSIYDFRYARNLINDYSLFQVADKQNFNALNDNSDLREKYFYFKKHYNGLLREKIVTLLILSAPKSNDISFCYNDAKKFVLNKDFRTALDVHCQSLPGSQAYNFTLLDSNNVAHHLTDFRGKVLILDFWFTGCGNCRELTPKLKLVEEQFKNDRRVLFISISSDKNFELWKSSIRGGLYTTSSDEFNLYTGGHGMSDPLYKKTNTYSAPTLKLIDAHGNWCENPVDCRFDDGKDLIAKIEKALVN